MVEAGTETTSALLSQKLWFTIPEIPVKINPRKMITNLDDKEKFDNNKSLHLESCLVNKKPMKGSDILNVRAPHEWKETINECLDRNW